MLSLIKLSVFVAFYDISTISFNFFLEFLCGISVFLLVIPFSFLTFMCSRNHNKMSQKFKFSIISMLNNSATQLFETCMVLFIDEVLNNYITKIK